MAEKTLPILMTARNLASGPVKALTSDLDKLGRKGGYVKSALSNVAKTGLVVGAAVAGAVSVGIHKGIDSLAELEDANQQLTGALALSSKVYPANAAQIDNWANQIEASVQAAFDDKEIVAGTAALVRYGNVAPDLLHPAMVVMTDLAAKTGDVSSAADALAKALADPTKATKVLRQAGVTLTAEETKKIKALVKAGKAAEAQKIILDKLSDATQGAAEAMRGPLRDAQNILADTAEDAERALATGFLPVLLKVNKILNEQLAKPETMERIKEFGQGLANGLDSAITIAQGLPWKDIGNALLMGGEGAKALVGAFTNLPDEAKGIILGLAALNKLTGGVPVKIAVDFAQGVFGQLFARGSSPANAMWVQSAGGAGVGATGAGGVLVSSFLGVTSFAAMSVLMHQNTNDIFRSLIDEFGERGLPDALRPTGNPMEDIPKLLDVLSGKADKQIEEFQRQRQADSINALLLRDQMRILAAGLKPNFSVSVTVPVSVSTGTQPRVTFTAQQTRTAGTTAYYGADTTPPDLSH